MQIRTSLLAKWQFGPALVVAVVAAFFTVACEGESPVGADDAGNLPPSSGTGTGTLRVVVEIQGHESGGSFQTGFRATVADTLGAPVSASVVVSGLIGEVQLAEEEAGVYTALRSGYLTGSYTLSVTSDHGSVSGVTVIAPGLHDITHPASGETVEAGAALNVRWTRAEPSEQCRLDTRDYDSDWIYGDPGTLYAPGVGNPPRTDQRIRIERRNIQTPAGGLFGSAFTVSVLRAVEPVVAQ